MSTTELTIPTGLSRKARTLTHAIVKFLRAEGATHTGGCRAFYSPGEWRDRGESYGHSSALVVVYDGGEVAPYFSLDACYVTGAPSDYDRYERMRMLLESHGFWSEQATSWYSTIQPL